MNDFRGVDFYRLDDLLSEEEKMVRNTVRNFVSEKVVPTADRHFEEATFPFDLIPEMASLGIFGARDQTQNVAAGFDSLAAHIRRL